MDKKLLTITIALMLFAIVVFPAAAGSTMMFRMNPARSGDYSSVSGGILPNNELRWAFMADSEIYDSPAVADGVVYVGSADGMVYAINADDHTQKWAFTAGEAAGSPAVKDGVVYVGSGIGCDNPLETCGTGYVYAINADDGSVKWLFDEALLFVHSSPAVVDGIVYVGSNDGNVYALDANDGSEIWKFVTEGGCPDQDREGGSVVSSPAVVDGVVYVGSRDHNVYAINADDGTQKWAFPTGDWVYSSPAVADGVVYAGSFDGNLYALDANDGSVIWTFETENSDYLSSGLSSPAVADGVVYVGNDTHVLAINANTGSQNWAFSTGDIEGYNNYSPAVADGVVYVGSIHGTVYAIDANDGSQKWFFVTWGSNNPIGFSPVVADGVVYVGSLDHALYAIGTGKWNPAITWTNPADITFGTPLSDTQLNAVASVPGTFTYTPPAGTVLDIGNNQNLHVDFTPTDTANYDPASMDVKINVLVPTVQDLISNVAAYDLPSVIENGLMDKLTAAQMKITQKQYSPARNMLNAFINQVNSQREWTLTNAQADALVAIAEEIINSIPGK